MEGRKILDCSLIANEAIDWLKKSGVGGVCFKVDFEKAYDTVDWEFLQFVMKKMGFGERWISWIRCCITTAQMSILVNGSPTEQFNMSRGLRQGCSLSPFLFNMVAEVLSIFLQKASSIGIFEGLQIGRLRLTHLQYADDTIIFCKVGKEQIQNVKRVLRCFQLVSGLKINFAKSSVMGIKVAQETLFNWAATINCKVEQLPSIYLGLPLGAPLKSRAMWKKVVEKFQLKLATWKARLLSFGGRVTLIKAVLSSFPVYYMSLLPMPCTIRREMEKIMRNFLWSGAGPNRKMHLVDWETICNLKELGGLGICNLQLRNRALLNKWLWRYGNERKSFWREMIVNKNGLQGNSIIPTRGNTARCSAWWRHVTLPLTQEDEMGKLTITGMSVLIGNGKDVDFWNDKWTAETNLKEVFPRIFALAIKKSGKACQFGQPLESKWEWQIQLRRPLFDWEKEQWNSLFSLLDEFQIVENLEDELIWKCSPTGKFTANSFCREYLKKFNRTETHWKYVWSGVAPPKVECFVWLFLRKRIAVKAELLKRGLIQPEAALCPICRLHIEEVSHLFLECVHAWRIWMRWCSLWEVYWVAPKEPKAFFMAWRLYRGNKGNREIWNLAFFAVIWSIWLYRNDIVFNGKSFDEIELFSLIKWRVACWTKAKWPEISCNPMDIYRLPKNTLEVRAANRERQLLWTAPEAGKLKFNVDGSVKGKPGPGGIGGVLKDEFGRKLMEFSKSVGVCDSNVAEILAIKEAILLFTASRWMNSHGIVIESDSKNAINWISNPSRAPWTVRKWVAQATVLKTNCVSFQAQHTLREANGEADALAKAGVDRTIPWFQVFGD